MTQLVLLCVLLLSASGTVQAAITYVKTVGTVNAKGTSSTTTTFTVGASGASAGNNIIIAIVLGFSAGEDAIVPACTDTKGNTYTTDVDFFNQATAATRTAICSSRLTTSLTTGDVITVTHASQPARALSVDEFSGLAATNPLDKTASGFGSSLNALSALTATTTQANELVFGAVGVRGPVTETYTKGASYTPLTRDGTTGSSATSNRTINPEYKIVSTTGTYAADGTLGTSTSWIAVVATYKAAAVSSTCTVTNGNDSGVGSLRQCIITANGTPGTTIAFNIPTTDASHVTPSSDHLWLLTPLTALPSISAANTIIDGTTQTANQGNTNTLGPEIAISGATVGAGGWDCFGVISPATNVTIKGFIINRFSGAGISLYTGTGSNTVTGNYIGTNYAGVTALANTSYGIYVNTNGNTIGGATAADRNVIAGNSGPGLYVTGNNNTIQGNYIGVNATASAALANTTYGINILSTATGNTIGGTAAGAGNVISGNTTDGINQSASGANTVQGNYIGTNAASASLPNGGNGLSISAGTINLGNASESQSNAIGPNTGVGINLASGTINLAGTINVRDDVTLSTGTLAMGSATLNLSGNWTRTSATITPATSTVVLNGASNQTITTGGASFNNLTLNNTGAAGSDKAVISGALTTSGALTVTDGTLDIGTNNPAVNTAGNVTISTAGSINVTGRTGTAWIFNGISTFTDSSSTGPQQLGSITVGGSSSTLNLASSMKVWSMTINAGNTANLGSGGYTLEITIGGTPLWNAGTFTAGISTVRYTGYLAGVTVAPNATFNSLELAPGGAATYSLGNATTVTGNLTIGANTTFTTTTNNYALNVAGNWSNSGTFVANGGTVTLNGANQTITGNTAFNNFTKSVSSATTLTFAAGSTTTINGLATINGASGQLLSLRSSVNGTRWNVRFAGTKSISFVDVRDSDASDSAAAQKPIGPTNSTDSGNNVDWFTILTVVKSMTIISDPLNNTTNPKAIPGAVIEYTITIANGTGASTATNIVVTDSLNANITAGRLTFNPNTYAAGQGVQVTAPNINGGAAQNLTNVADADTGDFNVTGANTVTVSGITLAAGQSATVKFRVTVQ